MTYAGPIQSLGTKIGILMGFSIFSIVERAFEEFTFNKWMIIMACTLIVTNMIILAFVSEGADDSKEKYKLALKLKQISLKETVLSEGNDYPKRCKSRYQKNHSTKTRS